MESDLLFVQESWLERRDDGKTYGLGDSEVYETSYCKGEIKKLFKLCMREYGRCTSKVYRDSDTGTHAIGWVFEKRKQYEDSTDTYILETWVTLHDAPPVKSIKYNYHFLEK